jgi:hypothetical protein
MQTYVVVHASDRSTNSTHAYGTKRVGGTANIVMGRPAFVRGSNQPPHIYESGKDHQGA